MSASTAAYTIPAEPGRYGALSLALLMHLALMAFFWFGIRWQNNEPVTVEAEVWDVNIREAAPKAPPLPPVEIKPEPKPEIKPEPTPEPKVEAKPDLVLERELKKKEQKKLEKLALEEKKKKDEKERLARLEDEKRLDQLKQDKLDKAKKDKELAKDKIRQEKNEQQKIDKLRLEQMARITGSGTPSATGEAARSTGPRGDPNYAMAIRAKIKSNLNFSDVGINSNPKVIFKVDLLPSGDVLNVKLLKSSGVAAFDEAVEKAISKASPLPKKKDGSVDREIEVTYNLKE